MGCKNCGKQNQKVLEIKTQQAKLVSIAKKRRKAKKPMSKPKMLPNGELHFPKRGKEPPPDINGYNRDKKNPWVFKPVWQDCQYRLTTFHKRRCGVTTARSVCRAGNSPVAQGSEVTTQICASCPLMR